VWEAEAMPAPSAGAASGNVLDSAAGTTAGATPGTVLDSVAGRIVVATGEGALALKCVQVEGRRAMTATEFLNAHSLTGAQLE
jgi:methionyl-tRNA formyltransferase